MSEVYDRELRAIARAAAERAGASLREGVYAAVSGPSYETPAEIRMLRTLGADLVGMSTVPEAIVARHMGARVLGISCVTNLAAGISPVPLSHEEVEATARQARDVFTRVVEATLRALPRKAQPR
jgi:purine-nucleoside phosphorylase